MKKGAAIFSILMGLAMYGTWVFLFLTGGVPQTQTVPLETGYLLTAEFLTATALVAGGCGILFQKSWALPLILIALGELIYCTIRFAGELGQDGSLEGLLFFTLVGIAAVIFAAGLVIANSRRTSS